MGRAFRRQCTECGFRLWHKAGLLYVCATRQCPKYGDIIEFKPTPKPDVKNKPLSPELLRLLKKYEKWGT